MARQRDSKLVGTVANLIFYNRLGEYCMRTKPVNVRRTNASIHSGFNFGKASRTGKQIRNLVSLIYPYKSDSLLINRLNGAINKFITWKEKMDAASRTMSKKLPIPASEKPGNLIIMVMAVQYMVNKNGDIEMLNDKKKLSCGIVWAGYYESVM